MKDYKRLAAGARLFNNQTTGYIIVQFEDFDGGPFELCPKLTPEGGLVLVDPGRPAGYGLEIRGSAGTLRRVAGALNALAKQQDAASQGVDFPDEE